MHILMIRFPFLKLLIHCDASDVGSHLNSLHSEVVKENPMGKPNKHKLKWHGMI